MQTAAPSSSPHSLVAVNRVLGALSPPVFEKLSAYIRPVYLPANDTIYNPGEAARSVFFPLDCVICTLAIMEDVATVEVSMVGNEGVVGISAIIGGGAVPNWTRVQIAGNAMRMRASLLKEMSSQQTELQRVLLRCYRAQIAQISQRSVCNCRHTLSQRLCCWLLMIRDRLQSDELPITQEVIAQRLGTRRAGITTAACILQTEDIISYSRGLIHIRDRARLESLACECYRIQRRAFESVNTDEL